VDGGDAFLRSLLDSDLCWICSSLYWHARMEKKMKTARIRAYGQSYDIQCDENPQGTVARCWGCTQRCEIYNQLRQSSEAVFTARLEKLKEQYKNVGTILESGHAACYDCEERPKECGFCLNDPSSWKFLQEPYILILVKSTAAKICVLCGHQIREMNDPSCRYHVS